MIIPANIRYTAWLKSSPLIDEMIKQIYQSATINNRPK